MDNEAILLPWQETDIPSEWREVPEGAILDELSNEESAAIELDRR